MNSLIEVLEEAQKLEYAEFDDTTRHRFSRRHCKAVNELLYPRTLSKRVEFRSEHIKMPIKRRILIALLLIILMALGVTAGAAALNGFNQKKHHDNTELLTVDAENCPKTIEKVYYLSVLPEGYEFYESVSNDWNVISTYFNRKTSSSLSLKQRVKLGYKQSFDTEHQNFYENDINGHYALCLDFNDVENTSGLIVWDNGDYILEIIGDFDKDKLIELAKSAKI